MTILLYDFVGADEGRPFSPHCWKAAMALAHKGLDFESLPTRATEIATIEGGAPKMVPTIRDGDRLVWDSFDIALYLEDAYPDAPTLFGGEGGRELSRFVERWALVTLHPYLARSALKEIHDMLGADDQPYFRRTRELRLATTIETAANDREAKRPEFAKAIEPLRALLGRQPFIGGDRPLFADYIAFGPFQMVRTASTFRPLDAGDPVAQWFERCLGLHGGLALRVPAA